MNETLTELVRHALSSAAQAGELRIEEIPEPQFERPRDVKHGDWATNIAMQLARSAGAPPREIAEVIARRMTGHPDIEAIEVAGPGFLNIRLSAEALQRILAQARTQGRAFGSPTLGEGRRVQVEFVSANPVGPMHVGHGRWAALGDSMARVLEHAGWVVEREFYINDVGVQMDIFAKSVAARYLEICGQTVDFEPEWYQGAYITEIAREIFDAEGPGWASAEPASREAHFKEVAYTQVLAHLKRVLHDFGVDFDVWFSERTLHAEGGAGDSGGTGDSAVESAIEALSEGGHIFEHEGAKWFCTTAFGDDKDRVLRKSDGSYTYFAADVAYHADKFERGFDRVINIWGADHHGYVKRMQAAASALGHEGKLDIVIGQLVNLFRAGEAVRMSKRTGEMVSFEDLLDEVGGDAARYFFLRRSTDQPLDFDIELAQSQSAENPVYYVQYAHARICSILRRGEELLAAGGASADGGSGGATSAGIAETVARIVPDDAPIHLLIAPEELALMRKLAEFEEVVTIAALQLAPFKLTRYAEELAAVFHQFYTVCRVIDPDDPQLTAARLYAVDATRIALSVVLDLIGVSAPEKM
ncbi:MAG: arginine--tRNA ligase [Actinobacteria bacterium]|nr:arginine--tRNA ligase [Actinomycetota bacterium]MCL5886967.1 arginine--tRNA ligase [Actinomycetota bacterium]